MTFCGQVTSFRLRTGLLLPPPASAVLGERAVPWQSGLSSTAGTPRGVLPMPNARIERREEAMKQFRARAPKTRRHIRLAALLLSTLAGLQARVIAQPPDQPQDQRLAQTVTFEADGEPLEAILRRLSKQTGVTFSFEGRDVGDRKAVVIVHGVSLLQLKAALAATFFGFRWREHKPKGRSQPEYVLFQDLRSRQIETQFQSTPDQQRLQRLRELQAGLHNGGQGLDLEGQRTLQDPGARTALQLLTQLPPGYLRTLFTTDHLTLSLGSIPLTPQQEQYWSQLAGQTLARIGLEQGGQHFVTPDDLKSAPPAPVRDLPDGKFTFIVFADDDGSYRVDLWLDSSRGAPGRALGTASIVLSRPGESGASSVTEVRAFLGDGKAAGTDAELEQRIKPFSPQQERELKQPVYQALYGPYWAHWLVPLAKRTGISVVSDYFTEKPGLVPKEPTGMTLRQALTEGHRVFQRRWVKCGPIYSFRHEHWYVAEPLEPPQRIIDSLKAAVRQKGRPDLDDLAAGGELTTQQVDRAECLGLPCNGIYREHYATMRLLNSLSSIQRRLAQANGIALGMLNSPVAREWFKTAAWKVMPELPEGQVTQLVLLVRQQIDANSNLRIAFDWQGPGGLRGSEDVLVETAADK